MGYSTKSSRAIYRKDIVCKTSSRKILNVIKNFKNKSPGIDIIDNTLIKHFLEFA